MNVRFLVRSKAVFRSSLNLPSRRLPMRQTNSQNDGRPFAPWEPRAQREPPRTQQGPFPLSIPDTQQETEEPDQQDGVAPKPS